MRSVHIKHGNKTHNHQSNKLCPSIHALQQITPMPVTITYKKTNKASPVFVAAAPGLLRPRNIALIVQLMGPSAVCALLHKDRRCLTPSKEAVALFSETAPSDVVTALMCADSVKQAAGGENSMFVLTSSVERTKS